MKFSKKNVCWCSQSLKQSLFMWRITHVYKEENTLREIRISVGKGGLSDFV